jgi:hypothetical protein
MDKVAASNLEPGITFEDIDTDWALVHEPAHVVLRYARAIQRYVHVLIANQHDAEEVSQEFFLWVSQHGLPRASKDRGRFRDYLKKVVRNAALNSLRRAHSNKIRRLDLSQLPSLDCIPEFDHEWIAQWRQCLIDRAWIRLKKHELKVRGSWAYTVLDLRVRHPNDDSAALAAKAVAITNHPFRAEAFRKQMSRARRLFAHMLVNEVALTLSNPNPLDVENELAELGLIRFVRDYLPLRRRNRV